MKRTAILVALGLGLALASGAWAQSGRGTIRGAVRDQSGAVLPGVEITATHQDTNVATAVRTNERGLYSVLNLPIGRYTLTFRKDGFNTLSREGISVGVNQAVDLDAALEVGGLEATVTVTADASLLGTGNAEVGTALNSRVVTDLPLSISGGRSLENFAYSITPSVEGNNWTSNIAGSPSFSKEVVIDGTSAVIQIGGHIGESSPPMEAVEEFKVQTSGIAAEYGRTAGGVFNFSLKSGGNAFSGSAYGYLRNEVLNANTWQNNFLAATEPSRAGEFERADDRQYVAGVSVGAPIIKDRTFAFASYEEYRQKRFVLGGFTRTVPIPAFLEATSVPCSIAAWCSARTPRATPSTAAPSSTPAPGRSSPATSSRPAASAASRGRSRTSTGSPTPP